MKLKVGDYVKVIEHTIFFNIGEFGKIIEYGESGGTVLLKTKNTKHYISKNRIIKIDPKENPEYFL